MHQHELCTVRCLQLVLRRNQIRWNQSYNKTHLQGKSSQHQTSVFPILNPDEYECWHDFMEVVNEWDKKRMMFRIKGMSWWERELPTEEEMNFGKEMLVENDNEVDFIISHCCPQQIAALFSHGMYKQDALTNYFDEIMDNTKFTRWYFGHYHDDRTIMGKFIMLYDSFERVV